MKTQRSHRPLGLYIHFPYCTQRCPYCDFTLTTRPFDHSQYVQAIMQEWKIWLQRAQSFGFIPRPLSSIYLGGGTPGLWDIKCLRVLFSFLKDEIEWSEDIEITLEANPHEVTQEDLECWREIGISRISLGTQSFFPKRLEQLGRPHTPQQAKDVVSWIQNLEFPSFNLDLIHGFVDQSIEEALRDLECVLELDPPHISLYQLTIESKTSFGLRAARGETFLANETHLAETYQALGEALVRAQVPLYEVSNAARTGHYSRHNCTYWNGNDYFALGTGAHGLIMNSNQTQGFRWQNQRHVQRYIDALLHPSSSSRLWVEEEAILDEVALLEERILVGLRLFKGVEVSPLMRLRYQSEANKLIQKGLLMERNGRWAVSDQGRLLLDYTTFQLLTGTESIGSIG